jgi:NADH-quinone oxidoreductase subunit M
VSFWLSLLGGMGMILGAAYMLYLYRRIIFGRITRDDLRHILDLSPREWAVFAPLIVLTLWMGVFPSTFTGYFDATVGALVQQHTASLAGTTRLASNLTMNAGPTPAGNPMMKVGLASAGNMMTKVGQ